MFLHFNNVSRGALYLLLFFSASFAAAHNTYNGNWDAITFTVKEKEKIFYYFKTEGRFYKKHKHELDELLMRPAIAMNVTKKISLWLGYDMYQPLYRVRGLFQGVWEQAQIKMIDSKSLNLVFRSRLEERFFEFDSKTALRNRNRAILTFKNLLKYDLSPVFYDELFLNLNHPRWVSAKTISQNRIFGGIKKQLNKTVDVMIGYLNRTDYNTHETNLFNLLSIEFEVKID